MDELLLFAVLSFLALLAGGVLGWISFFRLRRLEERLARLEAGESAQPTASPTARPTPEPAAEPRRAPPDWAEGRQQPPPDRPTKREPATPTDATGRTPGFVALLREHWMIWLGGLSVGLAGVFLVRYSIEQGYLGPAARIATGLLTGIALHALAEWLRRRSAWRSDAVAALAGGASLTLYAATLAALHLYQLWPVGLVFAVLALISLATLTLALWHGPVLAILGLLGGYAVPALLGTQSDQLVTTLAYSAVIALSGFTLMRYVYRDWLWWGTLGGALFWWWVALMTGKHTEAWLGSYLAVLAWGMLAIHTSNWRLDRAVVADHPPHWRDWLRLMPTDQRVLLIGLLVLLAALGLSLGHDPHWGGGPLLWLPLPAVLLIAARYNDHLRPLPWLTLAVVTIGLIATQLATLPTQMPTLMVDPVATEHHATLFAFLALLAGLFSAAGLWHLRRRPGSALDASLAIVAPLVAVALAYLLARQALPPWGLAVLCIVYGGLLLNLAVWRLRRGWTDGVAFWLVTGGHLAYSLAAVIALENATLTLALAAQLVSLTWVMRRVPMGNLHWLIKLVLAVVVIRLTLNPWLVTYPVEGHWTLWTYGGSLLLAVLASRQVPVDAPLRRWLEGGALHLLVLFLVVELRYWLYDGAVFAPRFDFLEAAIDVNLAAALGLVYHWRGQLSTQLEAVYRHAGRVMMVLALFAYFYLLTIANPLWGGPQAGHIGDTPLFNPLLLAYGLPVVLFGLASRVYEPMTRRQFAVVAGVGLWLFVSFEIRHLWQGELSLVDAASNGELYTYSAVWLLMAMAALLTGIVRENRNLYRGGMALLTLVILKIFLVDMSGLTGLLRAVSFMGLGLSLLALAYVHQLLARRRAPPDETI
ncbi:MULTISPECIES: DUF2339 domain-containing protein [unclassified Guyparkeria]|uniref:DUF2339 domain-containing protein n=1 Tax=unclassified Guyparkeria TaxID=2626246 RepID=UPI0007336106|nr:MULTISPECIES: DUF2339 domain-containing protein [unclassified Guyparkeria]KTG17244.1 hypothetical protein AUR63_08750 [Guyparkeria sp. XI15]OAE87221.1 hypothetical protein AWR35_08765 [Guyparkeria sp. WRN-7]